MRSLLFVSLLAVGVAGCAGSGQHPGEPDAGDEAVAARVQVLFDDQCTSCHSEPEAAARLDLEAAVTTGSLVDRPARGVEGRMLVAPGRPESSYLIDKLQGTHLEVGGRGARMPRRADALSDADVETIRRWIAAGAPR